MEGGRYLIGNVVDKTQDEALRPGPITIVGLNMEHVTGRKITVAVIVGEGDRDEALARSVKETEMRPSLFWFDTSSWKPDWTASMRIWGCLLSV